ncbi:transcription factor bhlh30 [Phtheirospermum japonicum]|uniref:Transcription factor bhlh30 n=1 Tax=Phtheirospermum japonicum TaxID=374723 RepID=A0A830AY57_9LAMI|nr:transcription factor bhlh30 [Phtheirospermum japonicum]
MNSEWDCGEFANGLSWNNCSGFIENRGIQGSMPVKRTLAFDDEKGKLMKDSRRMGKNIGVSETKTIAALKSHSEAERRRRERINAHLETLRALIEPSKEKMDKATLLAEVISHVKQLKKTAKQATQGLHLPMDTDDVQVEILDNNNNVCNDSFLLRASICCNHSPELLSDLRRAVNELPVQVLKCEISILGDRVKCVFLITTKSELIVSSVREALGNILDKVSASAEYAQPLFSPRKRQRVSYLDSSCPLS